MSISVVFDVAENLDGFIEHKADLKSIFLDYYLNFVIYYSNLFSAFITFLAVIFVVSKMARDTEVVPILSGGITYSRFLRPFIIGSLILASISLVMNHYVVPNANAKRNAFDSKFGNNKLGLNNVQKDIGPGQSVYFREFYSTRGHINDFWITQRNEKTGQIKILVHATRASGDSLSFNWKLNHYTKRVFDENNLEHSFEYKRYFDTTLNFNMLEFTQRKEISGTMTTPRLKKFISDEQSKGSHNISFYQIELHQRTSYPLATFILTLIGVSISSRKSRNAMGVNLVMGLLVVLVYLFSYKMTTVAALNIGFSPFWAVWIPNIIFALFGYFVYLKAPK